MNNIFSLTIVLPDGLLENWFSFEVEVGLLHKIDDSLFFKHSLLPQWRNKLFFSSSSSSVPISSSSCILSSLSLPGSKVGSSHWSNQHLWCDSLLSNGCLVHGQPNPTHIQERRFPPKYNFLELDLCLHSWVLHFLVSYLNSMSIMGSGVIVNLLRPVECALALFWNQPPLSSFMFSRV